MHARRPLVVAIESAEKADNLPTLLLTTREWVQDRIEVDDWGLYSDERGERARMRAVG
jgi:predicted restriction endonuclease